MLAILAISAATWVAGCSNDDDPQIEYVQVDHYTVTGFYIGPLEGGHMYIVVDRWGEKPALALPLHPSNQLPVGIRITLTPDDGRLPVELVGYGNTTDASGGGYRFSVASFSQGKLFGYISGPRGSGFCQGLIGSPDSIEVYLGMFFGDTLSGDTLSGRWNFVAPDTTVHGPNPSETAFLGMAFDSANSNGFISINGSYTPYNGAYAVDISGLGPGTQGNWSGTGTLRASKSAAGGTSDIGRWSVNRYLPPVP
jgi:hypothetical protein